MYPDASPLDRSAAAPHTPSMTSWRERWILWRNARLTDPNFQRWAARFPLTQGIARRRARALFDLVAGFTYSQVVAAVVETRLLPFLAGGPRSFADIAAHTKLPVSGAERLVKAAIALDLIEAIDGRYFVGGAGAALLGNPGVAEMVAHHRLLYADLADPVALLRRGRGSLADYWRYDAADDAGVAPYSKLMAASQASIAAAVLDAYPVAGHRKLLDIGGGEGVFLTAAGDRAPRLELALFDLPAVTARVTDPRISVIGGSFIEDPLPGDADLVSLVRVLHDHDDPVVERLLAKLHAAMPPGAMLLIAEPMADTPGAAPIGDAYFGMYLLAMGSGRPRTKAELTAMLKQAGFRLVRERQTAIPMLVRVLTAVRR